jgi:hypothetical protein
MGLPKTAARRWSGGSGAARRRSTAVEACGHRWHAPTSPADGKGDGDGEIHATTEGRRKSACGCGYHQEQ